MNPRNSNFQYIALFVGCISVAFGIYLYAPDIHRSFVLQFEDERTGTSTVSVSAERFARLEQEAAIGRPLQPVRDSLISTVGTSSEITRIGSSTPHYAGVIGRPPQSPYDTLVIDIGLSSNLELGAAAWWPPGVYLGEVVDIRQRTAVVQLVSSPSVRHSAVISGIPTMIEGRGGDELYAEVPETVDVSVGDSVISDQYEMPIGVVAAVRKLPTTSQQALYISRFISSSAIQNIYVES
jgi:hypothetical protein